MKPSAPPERSTLSNDESSFSIPPLTLQTVADTCRAIESVQFHAVAATNHADIGIIRLQARGAFFLIAFSNARKAKVALVVFHLRLQIKHVINSKRERYSRFVSLLMLRVRWSNSISMQTSTLFGRHFCKYSRFCSFSRLLQAIKKATSSNDSSTRYRLAFAAEVISATRFLSWCCCPPRRAHELQFA